MLLIALLGVDFRVLGVSKSHFYCLHFAISALTHFFPLLFAPVTRENDERRSARLRSAKGRRHRHRRPGREHIHHHRGSQDVPLPSKAGFVALELDGDQKINFRRHATAKNAKSGWDTWRTQSRAAHIGAASIMTRRRPSKAWAAPQQVARTPTSPCSIGK